MEDLAKFQLFLRPEPSGFMTLAEGAGNRSIELLHDLSHTTGAPSQAVASSVFMRRFGLFIAGQLYLLAHNQIWDGPLEKVFLEQSEHGITFAAAPEFIRPRQNGDLSLVLKQQAMPVVESFSKNGHVSKLILWENIWGYVIWMYGMTATKEAQADIHILLNDEFWRPEMKKSRFRQFLDDKTLSESQQNYRRITCCLYKELPETDKCPYCPLNK